MATKGIAFYRALALACLTVCRADIARGRDEQRRQARREDSPVRSRGRACAHREVSAGLRSERRAFLAPQASTQRSGAPTNCDLAIMLPYSYILAR